MSEETPAPEPPTAAERAEQRAIRRRWITIGELVAVAGLVIAALTFWNSWEERKDAAAERQTEKMADQAKAKAKSHRVSLIATGADSKGIDFKAQDGCALQSTDIRFPKELGVSPKTTAITHRIEADWVSGSLLRMTDGGADKQEGRLPVLIEARCTDEDGDRSEAAIYDVLWRTEPGGIIGIGGRSLRLGGLIRRQSVSGDGQPTLDAAWNREKPKS